MLPFLKILVTTPFVVTIYKWRCHQHNLWLACDRVFTSLFYLGYPLSSTSIKIFSKGSNASKAYMIFSVTQFWWHNMIFCKLNSKFCRIYNVDSQFVFHEILIFLMRFYFPLKITSVTLFDFFANLIKVFWLNL